MLDAATVLANEPTLLAVMLTLTVQKLLAFTVRPPTVKDDVPGTAV